MGLIIESLIIKYLQRECDEDRLQELLAWIDESEENRRMFFELKDIFDSNRAQIPDNAQIERGLVRLGFEISGMDSSHGTPPDNAPVRKGRSGRDIRRSHKVMRYAASIILAGSIGFGISNFADYYKNVQYNEVSVEAGHKSSIILSDGTKVTMTASTKLKYPTKFNKSEREVFLSGEAFFEVKHDRRKPFIVRSERQSVSVLGTSFNV